MANFQKVGDTDKAQTALNTAQISQTTSAVLILQTSQKAGFLDNHILKGRAFEAFALNGNFPNHTESTNAVTIIDGVWRRLSFIFAQKNNFSGYGRNAINTRFKPPSLAYYLVILSLQINIDANDTTARTINMRMVRTGVGGEEFFFRRTLKNDTGIKAYYMINHHQVVQLSHTGEYSFDLLSDGANLNDISSATNSVVIMRINSDIGTTPAIYP